MSPLNLILQTLHNLMRWAVLVVAVIALVRAAAGWLGRKQFNPYDQRAGMLYSMLIDVQLLLGLLLYLSKGWINVLFGDFGATFRDVGLRFFAVEHFLLMLLAAVVIHIGSSSAKKAATDTSKYRRLTIWFGLSFLLLLAAIPWPFLSYGRPWLRLFGLEF